MRLLLGTLGILAACTNPIPDRLESEFVMAKHSLPFANSSTVSSDALIDSRVMRRMFGDTVCQNGTVPCQLTAAAQRFARKANRAQLGGRCEGFAVAATLMQSDKILATDFGAENARELFIENNSELQRELSYWFTTQLHPSVTEQTKGHLPKDVMLRLVEALSKNAKERFRIGIVRKQANQISGGHTLTPIAFYRDPALAGVYLLRVYDSSLPDGERTLKIDTQNNRWEYEASEEPRTRSNLYFGDESNKNPLYLSPVFSRMGQLPCHFCDESQLQITSHGGVQFVVANREGETGIVEGELKAAPGSSVSPIFSAENDSDGASFVANTQGGDVVLTLRQGDEGAFDSQRASVELQSASYHVLVDGLRLTATDTLSVKSAGATVTYENSSQTDLNLELSRQVNGKNVTVATSLRGKSDHVSVSIDEQGVLMVDTKGSEGTGVVLSVSVEGADGKTTSGTLSYESARDSSVGTNTTLLSMSGTLEGTLNNGGVMMRVTNACADRRVSGIESDVDCGGTCSTKCENGQHCSRSSDCSSSFCNLTNGTCVATQCEDGIKAPDETDVDCGGASECGGCAAGRTCRSTSDCVSDSICQNSQCRSSFLLRVRVVGMPELGTLELTNQTNLEVLTLSSNGEHAFPSRVLGAYAVEVSAQPFNAMCSVTSGSGTASAPVTLAVNCSPRYAIGGTVSGLRNSDRLTLQLNNADTLPVLANGAFFFPMRIAGPYEVTVQTQPAGSLCSVVSGVGNSTADVTNIRVTCQTSGSLDTTWNGVGFTTQAPTSLESEWFRVALNPDHSQVWVGRDQVSASDEDWLISKLTPAGTLDSNFGTGGHLHVSRGVSLSERARAIHRNADGSYLVAGTVFDSGNLSFAVAKVTERGLLDMSFGTGGLVIVDFAAADEHLADMKVSSSGIFLAGSRGAGAAADVQVVKLSSAGVLDGTFGTGGRFLYATSAEESASAIDVNAGTGDIFVVGSAGTNPSNSLILSLSAAGQLNSAFGSNGVLALDLSGTGGHDALKDVVLAGGNLLCVGVAQRAGNNDALVAEFESVTGAATTFGGGGVLLRDSGGRSDQLLTVLSTGNAIFAAGESGSNLSVLKLSVTGVLDPNFATAGEFLSQLGSLTAARAYDIAVDGAGRIVTGGMIAGGRADVGAARLNP